MQAMTLKIPVLLCILSKNAVDTAQSKIRSCLKVINCRKESLRILLTAIVHVVSVMISVCKFDKYLQLLLDGMS